MNVKNLNINTSNNKIAKNTILLYVRMLLLMVINLYTSRVILNTLGIEDYGIYNVVSGFIAMLGFLSSSLGVSSSRFITYDLGKGDVDLMKKTFGNILTIHLLLAIIVFLIGESIGLWFVINKLQIPEDRITAAIWVYEFSIFSFMISIISVPYNATIIAHERMKAFAYISIVDAILKLVIVYLLTIIPYDKLIIYAFLFFCIQCFDRIIYSIYCYKHFEEVKTKFSIDRSVFKEIFGFAIWTMNGSMAVIGYTQGINILLNVFFGPVINAARGIAVQVQTVVRSFCSNFQMALNPQITKSYAQNNLVHMQQLVKLSSKFSFFLLFIISLPLALEAPLVLKWWLVIVPENTVIFLRLVLCSSLLIALSNPLVTSVHATGKIKRFQAIEGTMLLSVVPIAYILLKFWNIRPEYVFCVHIVVEIFTQYARVIIVLPMISMKPIAYLKEVILPIIKVIIITPILPLIVFSILDQSVYTFIIICFISVISVLVGIYYLGCTASEKEFVKDKIGSVLKKHKKQTFLT